MRPRPTAAWSPRALVALADAVCRARVTRVLGERGWQVEPHPSGFHLVVALERLVAGEATVPWPSLIVVDAISAGCLGITLAAGLRELEVPVPIVLVDANGHAAEDQARRIYTATPAIAPAVVAALAGDWPRPLLAAGARRRDAA